VLAYIIIVSRRSFERRDKGKIFLWLRDVWGPLVA